MKAGCEGFKGYKGKAQMVQRLDAQAGYEGCKGMVQRLGTTSIKVRCKEYEGRVQIV